ncbi:MAG: DUF3987 domain-containing protein [Candidatus Competibacteraceae bacterium]|nr:DUF3987 domain-containing protein [Candidatus Competibacteraceae bacterium]
MAFDEMRIPKCEQNWIPDYGDGVVPRGKGFITDFVYHTRGYMIPTLACIWSALYVLSAAVKREAWLKWKPEALYVNLYMIIVGPAGRAKKTTAISSIGAPILRGFRNYVSDQNLYKMKYVHIVKDMTSTEALIDAMLPEKKPQEDFYLQDENKEPILDKAGKAIGYKRTSETAIIVSELSTFLSSRSYADTLTQLLLDLYDCHPTFEWRTLGRGTKTLRKLYTSFVAGTTVQGLRESIPQAAKGDGFMSRTILVYVPTSKRKYPEPFEARGAPTLIDMQKD